MHVHALTALACGLLGPPAVEGEGARTIELRHEAIADFDIVLPKELWSPADYEIPIPHRGGEGFSIDHTGAQAIRVDTNGDGRTDEKVMGVDGFVRLRAKDEKGERFEYAARLKYSRKQWWYAASGAASGRLNGERIRIIDQNNNGRYDDYGEDALLIGRGDAAGLLSRVINVKGELFELEVAEDGRAATVTPYEGVTGHLDLVRGYESKGKLLAAIVSADSGEVYFNAARDKKGMLVPAGTYRLDSGYVARKGESARIRGGDLGPIEVSADELTSLEWGGPLACEFDFDVRGDRVTVEPRDLEFVGMAGEQYYDFQPKGVGPKIVITNDRSNKPIESGRFKLC